MTQMIYIYPNLEQSVSIVLEVLFVQFIKNSIVEYLNTQLLEK